VKIIVIVACSILCSLLTSSVFKAFAALEDDIKNFPILARQNKRTFDRAGDFIQQCGDKVASNQSLIPTCDSLVQKLNIEIGKFLAENQAVIEDFLYPYFSPSSVHTYKGLSSENVTGDTDSKILAKHLAIFLDYTKPARGIFNECLSRALSSYDTQVIYTCKGILESLNSHLKVFNQNTRSEFEKVLNPAIP